MNSSSYNYSLSDSLIYRDSLSTALAKNVIVVALGLTIGYINGTLIHTFRKHQILYVNPRYILFIHLVVNDTIHLTTTISLFVFSYVFYSINVCFCCIIVTAAVFTTLNTPLNLAVMAVECYIAICLPLRHAEFCTIKRTYVLIGCMWAMSTILTLPDVFIIVATEPVHFFYSTILCHMDNVFRHPINLKKRDVSHIIYQIGIWLILVYTYLKIFFAAKTAKSADRDNKKARNTILLHGFQLLLCMLTYVNHVLSKALSDWFTKHSVHIAFVLYIIIQILPRFVSPIVYGLRDQTFRQHLKKHLLCTVRASIKPQTTA